MIDIRHITAYQQATKAIQGVSLTIEDGERVAILGPNGSGKSTLLKVLSRDIYPVDTPDSYVRVFDKETVIWEFKSKIGIVSQDLQEDYTPYTTALDVVTSGFFGAIGAHDHLQPTSKHRQLAEEMLDRVGMAPLAQRMFQRLSTGQKRRLLIARALVNHPKALILDEPSAGLDIGASTLLLNLLRQYCSGNHSIIIATHHIDEIIPEIERVVLLKEGRVVADGPKEAILTGSNLSELYMTDLEVSERGGWYRCWQQ
ncbi:ATP-binding cassette domain-containing protein [Marinobacter sp. NP-4(2019)]|uniref:ABC transporter ATP-binding protein n=1 Tax=Marinobacter sp. NP-4(2019) TaxID=2488665 RepID=UPI000FC3F38A|nr:ATP-binding cassette domain-containing protein [Marinobacter sp. NP-4(2019)]AZT85796.1 ATP-binding cassette domain-containing protein [Marinobacter sp. NP-4(2019)]